MSRLALSGVAVCLFGGALAYLLNARRASERTTMPRGADLAVATPESTPRMPRSDASHRGVAIRLVDELGNAKLDVPSILDRRVRAQLNHHWRRHHAPFTGPGGEIGRLVQSVGLQRKGAPTPKSAPSLDVLTRAKSRGVTGSDKEPSDRDIRTFGLGDGSYDQRECVVAPTPSSLRFSMHIPRSSVLRVAPAVLGESAASFTIAFRANSGGGRRILASKHVEGPTRRYDDWIVDLEVAGLGESDGELELRAESNGHEPAIALWGSPVIVAPRSSSLPYNVLFVIVDAMRSDAIAATHNPEEDAQRRSAQRPPLDAWFEAMPEVAPQLDRLAARGAVWEHSWSAAMWTRPATLAILTGQRASHTGLDILALELIGDQRRNFYARKPPLLPLMMRHAGATTAAFVNNMYLSGSVGVGVDFAFESLIDHRMQALDTRAITNDALRFLGERAKERFFLLLNYASPHAPYLPPPKDLRAVHAARNRPADLGVQNYLGEVHKDDAAIGEVLRRLDELNLSEETLVVVTADHGETMSTAHDVIAVDVAQGVPSGRFTHLSTMWEEAARVALVMALPGRIPSGIRLGPRVQTIDIAPTVLELEGLAVPRELAGRSLVPLFSGKSLEERPVVIEGRGARSIIEGRYHCIIRDPIARRLRHMGDEFERAAELYDLESDPGERKDIAAQHHDIVANLRSKLEQMLSQQAPVADLAAPKQRLHIRFATSGKIAQLEFTLKMKGSDVNVIPAGIELRAIRSGPDQVRIVTTTSAERAVGFELELRGSAIPAWEVSLNGNPWPEALVFAGPLGQQTLGLARGLGNGFDATKLDGLSSPHIVATEETGMFVTRDPVAGTPEVEVSAEAQLEAQQAMQAWGYARKPTGKKLE